MTIRFLCKVRILKSNWSCHLAAGEAYPPAELWADPYRSSGATFWTCLPERSPFYLRTLKAVPTQAPRHA